MTAKPGLEYLVEFGRDYGFMWGDLSVSRCISHVGRKGQPPTRVVSVVDTRTGKGLDIYVSPNGHSVRAFPVKHKPMKEYK